MPLLTKFAVDFPQAVFLSLRVVRDEVLHGKEEASFMEHAGPLLASTQQPEMDLKFSADLCSFFKILKIN